jgi:CMP-N-acetylneuraminic acid synthetase
MAVTRYLESPFQALVEDGDYLRPCFERDITRQSQSLPTPWVDSGSFYFARVEALRTERTFYGKRLVGAPIPRHRSIDIDTPEHLVIAEALLEARARDAVGR